MLLDDTTTFLSAQHFIAAVGHSILPFVSYVDEEPAGIAWLYNIAMAPPKMTPISAFTAGYVLPQFRAAHLRKKYEKAYMALIHEYGITHLWAETRTDNMLARHSLRASGFHRIAILPCWKRYRGKWMDMVLYHLSLETTSQTDKKQEFMHGD
jgi:ribosomal protein S18 acetylase RimI-like enzyme